MHPVVYTPRDRPEVSRLYVLFKGTVKYAGKALGPGKIFGEQDVLLRGHFVIREQASCKTYVHANFIGQEDLYHLAADYPAAMRGMKANVMWNALRRYMRRFGREILHQKARGLSVGGPQLAMLTGSDTVAVDSRPDSRGAARYHSTGSCSCVGRGSCSVVMHGQDPRGTLEDSKTFAERAARITQTVQPSWSRSRKEMDPSKLAKFANLLHDESVQELLASLPDLVDALQHQKRGMSSRTQSQRAQHDLTGSFAA